MEVRTERRLVELGFFLVERSAGIISAGDGMQDGKLNSVGGPAFAQPTRL